MASWTTPRTWVASEVVTDAEMNANIRDNTTHLHDWLGEIGYNQLTTDLGVSSTSLTTICTTTPTIPTGGRNIKVTGFIQISGTIAGDQVIATINMGATELQRVAWQIGTGINPPLYGQILTARVAAPASGSTTFTLKAQRTGGSGTATMRANTNFPAYILVEGL